MIFAIPLFIFVFVALTVFSIYWLMFGPANAVTERLRQIAKPGEAEGRARKSATTSKLAERVASPINRVLPPSPTELRSLQKKLLYAGYRSPQAAAIYRAIQLICLAGFPAFNILILTLLNRAISDSLGWLFFAALAGYLLPRYTLDRLIRQRQQRIRLGLGDALDLLIIVVEAGMELNAAIVRVAEELKVARPEICEELELLNLEIRVGRDRAVALRNLGDRTGVDDVKSLVAMLVQTDRFGTSIADSLRVFADSMRTKRRQRAEELVAKAAIKLIFPLLLFIFPALLIVLMGPALIRIYDLFGAIGSQP